MCSLRKFQQIGAEAERGRRGQRGKEAEQHQRGKIHREEVEFRLASEIRTDGLVDDHLDHLLQFKKPKLHEWWG